METAEIYGLKVIEANINKSGENTTRFAVLSKVKAASPSLSSTVLMFTVKHEVNGKTFLKLYNERIGIYQATADVVVPDMTTPEAKAEYILEKRMELIR